MNSSGMRAYTMARIGYHTLKILATNLKDEAYRKEFEEWYLKRYGTPYRWKTKGDRHE